MSTTVSAPGKVLIAGGYLVLDRDYSGLVVSTSSRFYTSISSSGQGVNCIKVRSPQFKDATWSYSIEFDANGAGIVTPNTSDSSKNKFVHLALQKTLAVAVESKGLSAVQQGLSKANGLDIAIVGDNDFYSQGSQLNVLGLPRSLSSLDKLKPFGPTGVSLSDVHKTGLGSSAALITSLVTGLLIHLEVITSDTLSDRGRNPGKDLAHNLAQYIHCLAQGKVGSGFDVSAAVFGSHLYTRFNTAVIADALNDIKNQPLLPVVSPENTAWDYRIIPFRLPPLTRILLADVDAGSDTPSLVGKVLKWRGTNSDQADALWKELNQQNQSLAAIMQRLSQSHKDHPDTYESIVRYLASIQAEQWISHPEIPANSGGILSAFSAIHKTSQAIRAHMKNMGELSEVPIEPTEQSQLLDSCMALAGVIGGGVPGAGGFDAIWLLVLDPVDSSTDEAPSARVDRTWANYTALKVTPLSAKESVDSGVRIEEPSTIKGFVEAIKI